MKAKKKTAPAKAAPAAPLAARHTASDDARARGKREKLQIALVHVGGSNIHGAVEALTEAEAVETFKTKAGIIQSEHPFKVDWIDRETLTHLNSTKPAGFTDLTDPVEEEEDETEED